MSKLSTSPHLKYRFWIEAKDRSVIEWTNLTDHQLKRLESLTEKTVAWSGVKGYGWEVMK